MSEESPRRRPARLVALNGDCKGMVYELTADETMIGRNPTSDISLLDDGISREHAIISFEESESEYVVEDLQSTNGTQVNGKRVRSASLAPNDELRFGNTSFRFEIAAPTPD